MKSNEICGIYSIINSYDGKMYIGSSSNIPKRYYRHLNSLRNCDHENRVLQRAFNKYGEKNFILAVIDICAEKDLLKIEQEWLNNCDRSMCYNINYDSNKPPSWKGKRHKKETKLKMSLAGKKRKHSPEAKEKIKEAWKIRRKLIVSDNTRKKLSLATKGSNNPMYGHSIYDVWLKKYGKEQADIKKKNWIDKNIKSHAHLKGENNPARRPEVRKKISKNRKGIPMPPEAIRQMKLTRKGRSLSESTKRKMSLTRKGELNAASKLTDIERKEIFNRFFQGISAIKLSKIYNVTKITIYNAIRYCHDSY